MKPTRDELLAALRGWHANDTDAERAHAEADDLLLAYIDDPEVAEAYDRIVRWYS